MAEWAGALLCLQSDLSGLQGGDRGRERETTPVAGQAAVTSLLAGCVNSTSDLYGNRADSTPLLPSDQTVGTRGDKSPFYPSLSAPCWAVEFWDTALHRAGHDETGQLWQRDLSGRPGLRGLHCWLNLGSEMAQLAQSRCQSGSHALV